jgi:hypothetical protein
MRGWTGTIFQKPAGAKCATEFGECARAKHALGGVCTSRELSGDLCFFTSSEQSGAGFRTCQKLRDPRGYTSEVIDSKAPASQLTTTKSTLPYTTNRHSIFTRHTVNLHSQSRMTDSPFTRFPLDPKEQPILDRLLGLRDQLSVLKSDRTSYIRTQDVLDLYTKLIGEVEKLNELRTDKRSEQNRVDTVLDDCFQLVSLFFLTIGRNQEAPAVYSAVSTVKVGNSLYCRASSHTHPACSGSWTISRKPASTYYKTSNPSNTISENGAHPSSVAEMYIATL